MFGPRLRNAKALFSSARQPPIFLVPDLRILQEKKPKALLGWPIYQAYAKDLLLILTYVKHLNHVWNAQAKILLNKGKVSDMIVKEFISIDDDILTGVPIDNTNDTIQRHTNKDSSDDDECNINENISGKEQLSIKSYVSFLDTVPEL
ncbi:hypothetical protein AVEN_234623-1 [Araneus ventricosus]|uniref:Uncharacterized protein n=1 Tax=Araneus ventricosus TaxID=182803 RepID=A0A4Y2SBR6_ARAVE|nr:hypothetical protein AVEN_234623-1 [Araneus ventricosus]